VAWLDGVFARFSDGVEYGALPPFKYVSKLSINIDMFSERVDIIDTLSG
jgi:hypothetical protein